MNNFRLLAASAAILLSSNLCAAESKDLFDGRSLDGWEGNAAQWRVEDGAITGEIPAAAKLNHNEFLFWKGQVADFDLTLEYRISGGPSANSGIQFRSQRRPDGSAMGYQADLDDGAVWLGRIYDEEKRGLIMERGCRASIAPDGRRWSDPFAASDSFRNVPKKDGWNRYRLRSQPDHTCRCGSMMCSLERWTIISRMPRSMRAGWGFSFTRVTVPRRFRCAISIFDLVEKRRRLRAIRRSQSKRAGSDRREAATANRSTSALSKAH
jgi:hypothetical protein